MYLLNSHLSYPKSSIAKSVQSLKDGIEGALVYRPRTTPKFVFLCGANKGKDEISERRKALIDFARTNLPNNKFFLAEKVFNFLKAEGHQGNLIDIEHDISRFSDNIIIILESPSSFAELGAFSHRELREKLIVINDKKFEKEESFVNLGPIQSVVEVSGKSNIINYKMKKDGVSVLDGIGETFNALYEILKAPVKQKEEPLFASSLNPALAFDRDSVNFVHDLVYFSGPVLHKEIVAILKSLFGDGDYKKVMKHLGLLGAFDTIYRDAKTKLYSSKLDKPFLSYEMDTDIIVSTFRNFTQKHNNERFASFA